MNKPVDNARAVWSTPIAVAWAPGHGALFLFLASFYQGDLGRALIPAAGAVVLTLVTVTVAIRRPRLALVDTPTGTELVVRGLTKVDRFAPASIDRIRVHEMSRIGRRTAHLEIDARDETGTERLLIFSWWDLGAPPHTVLAALREAGFSGA